MSADTASFQGGVGGYNGTVDGLITSSGGGNGGNDFTSASTLIMINTVSNYEAEALVRWGSISLPAGSTVTSAQVSLTFEDFAGGHNMKAYYVKSSWDTNARWVPRTSTLNWATPGAKGVGTDITSSTPAFSDTNWTAAGVQTRQYSLDPAVVQGWIDNPSTNQGLILTNAVTDKQLRVYTSRNTTLAYRPQLTITYTVGGGGADAGVDSSADASSNCWTVGAGVWRDDSFTAQTAFTAELDATPSAVNVDEVMGFSSGPANQQFTNLEAIARFYTDGLIEARNGASYTADNTITYTAGTSYHFKFVIDVPSRTYSVYVTPAGGSQITLATNYAFRSDAPLVSSLSNLASQSTSGTLQVCNLSITPTGGGGGGTTGDHPRIWLDTTTIANLKTKALQSDARWVTLRAKCHAYLAGTVWTPPNGISPADRPYCGGCSAKTTDPDYAACQTAAANDSGCNMPDICCGYQGAWFYDALLNNALCYQIGTAIGDTEAPQWGQKGVDVLMAMASFQNYGGDQGFGIKYFGPAMSLGFDWLYPLLTASQKSTVVSRLNGWVSWYDGGGIARNVPLSNYFAGYYATKAYVGLATEGDNDPTAANTWSDFMNRLYRGTTPLAADGDGHLHPSVADYFKRYVNGSGYPQGWEYSNLSLRNMIEPMIAAKTAKALDLIKDATQPFSYGTESARQMMYAAWPSLAYADDRDDIHSGECPGLSVVSSEVATSMSSILAREGDPLAPQFHSWARTIRSSGLALAPWLDFLFWDDTATEASYNTLPMAYLSSGASTPQGTNYAFMRSGWTATDTWASLRAMAYTNSSENAHQFQDAGSLAITRGGKPFLVNPSFLVHCYGSTSNSFDNFLENNTVSGSSASRQFFNIFYTSTSSGQQWIEAEIDRSTPPQTGITKFDASNTGYVLTQAEHLADLYPSTANISAWSRSVLYVRPNIFVVYDRTTTTASGANARMSWHFPPAPTPVSAPTGTKRFDVTDSTPTDGGFKGAIATLLPQNALVSAVNAAPTDDHGNATTKLYRVDVKAPSGQAAPAQWLTVLDASSTTGAVAVAQLPIALTSNAVGAYLTSSGQNYVVLFGAGAVNAPITTTVQYTQANVATKLVVNDLQPSTSYSVTATPSGTNYIVTIQTGTGFTTSSAGTLYVNISATGQVTAGT